MVIRCLRHEACSFFARSYRVAIAELKFIIASTRSWPPMQCRHSLANGAEIDASKTPACSSAGLLIASICQPAGGVARDDVGMHHFSFIGRPECRVIFQCATSVCRRLFLWRLLLARLRERGNRPVIAAASKASEVVGEFSRRMRRP